LAKQSIISYSDWMGNYISVSYYEFKGHDFFKTQ